MYRLTKILLLFFATTSCLIAQFGKSGSPLESINQMKQATTPITNINDELLKEVFPVGNAVDPDNYYVGPNDILSIQIMPFDIAPVPVVVTSECSIVHKNFGEVKLNGITLTAVREQLNEIVNSRSSNSKVIVSLLQPRKVFVVIKGNVVTPGTYIFPASYSISTAIKYANQAQSTQSISSNQDEQSAVIRFKEAQKERERLFSESGVSETALYGYRNIRLLRANGTSVIVDLERAVATNNSKYNPFVGESDEIFVPFEVNDYPMISIAGEVMRPTSVVYKAGDSASHLIKMGYGFTENADLNNVKICDAMGNLNDLKVDSVGNLISNDFPITPGTIIKIGAKPKIEKNKVGIVSVKGEINKPDIYVIELGKTRLTDIIQLAGGFTESAYLPLATISRRDNSQNERVSHKRKFNEFFNSSILTQQDTMRTGMAIDMQKPLVSCDFIACFIDKNEDYNLILQEGDVINIPNKPNKVNVYGQVKNPGYVDFTENQSMEWYVNKAGGYATSADIKRTRIIRGSNLVWVDGFKDSIYVFDGDRIYVPPPRDVAPEMELQKWAAYAGLTGAFITLISVLYNIFGK